MRALLLLLVAAPCAAQVKTVDKVLVATSSALIVADWWLTMDAIGAGLREQGRHETNPLLPEYPGKGHLTAMVALGLAANVAVLKVKQPWLRRLVWATVIAFEVEAVGVNIRAGSRFRL